MKLPIIIKGKVKKGKGKGHTVGMPTANIDCDFSKIDLEYGVYASYAYIDDKKYKSVTNVGLRPSVDDSKEPTIETYIIDFSENIYEKLIKIELVFYIRGIQKFDNLLEVKKQVDKDIMLTKENLL